VTSRGLLFGILLSSPKVGNSSNRFSHTPLRRVTITLQAPYVAASSPGVTLQLRQRWSCTGIAATVPAACSFPSLI